MANLDGFDASQQQAMRSFDPVPTGDYLVMAKESEMKDTNAGDGKRLIFTWEIVDGDQKGRLLWSSLNMVNKSQTAMDIAKRELGDICKAVGIMTPKDSSELHGKPLIVKVKVEARKDNGEMTSRIKGYTAAANSAGAVAAPAQATLPANGTPQPPWAG